MLFLDEIKIREDLIYDKNTDINNHLLQFERSLQDQPTPMLADIMLVFILLQYPYAQFPCVSVTGNHLYNPVWEAVYHLERCGFQVQDLLIKPLLNTSDFTHTVMGITFDGASVHRQFLTLTKVPNKYASETWYVREQYYVNNYGHLFPHNNRTIKNKFHFNTFEMSSTRIRTWANTAKKNKLNWNILS